MTHTLSRSMLAAALCVGCLLTPASLRAQNGWASGEYMIQAVSEVLAASDLIQEKGPYGYAEGASLVGILLNPGDKYTVTRTFERGMTYAIVGGGDDDVRDLDIRILDMLGNEVVSDTSDDRMAGIDWVPKQSGEYQIELELYDATRDSFCCFIVLRKGGVRVERDVAVAATRLFFEDCYSVVEQAEQEDAEVSFHAGEAQPSLFGMVLGPEESLEIPGIVPLSGTSVLLGRSHDAKIDVDLYVTRGGIEVGQDILNDACPRYVGRFNGRAAHEMTLRNQSIRDSAFVVGGILQVRERR